MSNTLIRSGTAQRSISATGSIARSSAPNRRPASSPGPGRRIPEVGALEPGELARERLHESPAAHAPATSAPALEPEACAGRSPRAARAESMPVWAKKPKKPLDIASPNGPSASQSPRVVTAPW